MNISIVAWREVNYKQVVQQTKHTKTIEISMLLKPLLNSRTKSMVGNKIAVFQLKVCHGRCVMSTIQPSSQSLGLISEAVRCHMRILHYFLQVWKLFKPNEFHFMKFKKE